MPEYTQAVSDETIESELISSETINSKTIHSESINSRKLSYENTQEKSLGLSQLPKQSLVPGGIALISFTADQDLKPKAFFNNKAVAVFKFKGEPPTIKDNWIAVIGLGLSLTAGQYELDIQLKNKKLVKAFSIHHKEYEAQYITLENKAQVSPSAESLERIRRESKAMKQVFNSWTQLPEHFQAHSLRMEQFPTEGPQSSQFGLKRFFNNQARRPHSGLDIAAETGMPIQNFLPGKVAAVGNYFFNGNTVLVDHGYGIIAMYCHLDTIQVELDQYLDLGDSIGTVGSTGRATGPHLHWSMSLNNTRVDPLLFVRD